MARVLQLVVRRLVLVSWDISAWALALTTFTLIRYDWTLSQARWGSLISYLAAAIVMQLVLGFGLHLYLGRSRLGSFEEATLLGAITLVTGTSLGVVFAVFNPYLPRAVAVAVPALALILMASARWLYRSINGLARPNGLAEATPALVYGAGDAGEQIARLVDTAADAPYRLVGYLDDDPAKRFLRIHKYRVLGTGSDLIQAAKNHDAEMVILAITEASGQMIQDLSDRCHRAGLQFRVVPPVREMIGGQVTFGQIREFDVADLLGRRQIETDLSSIASYVTGKVVMVTGAGGSIGSELARQVKRLGPSLLVLLDRDESALHAVQLSLYGQGLLNTDDMALCSIRDPEALEKIFVRHRPEVVFHAAALKHLPMLEMYPDEGWKTNVLGTLNVLRCARRVGVKHFVNISTDKAADPTCVLGRTKRAAERLTAWFAQETGANYLSVRFGNVLGSRGSVLYTFKAQIERGGPVTVTHPDVTRFFMTIPEACELVLQAGAIGKPGDVLVLDMGEPVKIFDVARRLIETSGRPIDIEFVGLRAGEKMDEVLLSSFEQPTPSEHPLITEVSVPPLDPSELQRPIAEPQESDVLVFAERRRA